MGINLVPDLVLASGVLNSTRMIPWHDAMVSFTTAKSKAGAVVQELGALLENHLGSQADKLQ